MVEFGCGYGTFTIPAAGRITGKLFAFDIEAEMVAATCQKVTQLGLSSVVARVRDFVVNGTGLADGMVDYAMLFNILHIENPIGLLREAFRVLAPGGSVGMIHWRNDIDTPRGPSQEIRPSPNQCRAWGEQAGLEFVREVPLCCCSWHWGMVMRRPEHTHKSE